VFDAIAFKIRGQVMRRSFQLSSHTLNILKTFLEHPLKPLSAPQISRGTQLSSGSLFPMLLRFQQNGLLESHWENQQPQLAGGRRRRLYRISDRGRAAVRRRVSVVSRRG
jgi:hypothetical protein